MGALRRIDRHGVNEVRIAAFVAAIMPMAIWLITDATLARPMEISAWAFCCALAVAALPSGFLRLGLYIQLLLFPFTVAWIGAVAVTGSGTSIASTASISAGAFHEVIVAMQMAACVPSFWIASLASLGFLLYALNLSRKIHCDRNGFAPWLFLCCLGPLSLAVLDAAGYRVKSLSQWMGTEARVSVVWLSHVQVAKECLNVTLDFLVFGSYGARNVRQVSAARHEFKSLDGVALFIVGESLRADSFLKVDRGPWSAAMMERIRNGLGARLPDACAGGNATFVSVPRLLTAARIDDLDEIDHGPSILARAKAGGAATAFINNHEVWVFPELGHDLMIKTSSMNFNAYDEVTVEALGDFLKRSKAKSKAAVLHWYGQHFDYENRYPKSAFAPEPKGLSSDELLELRYSRAAEYGVKPLLDAAAILDAQSAPSFLIFTSDHGENLPSDNTGKRIHAGPLSGKADIIVPAVILWNKAFKDSGRLAGIKPLLDATQLIAHRDLAIAWLSLVGASQAPEPTAQPESWGAVSSSPKSFQRILCSQLPP